MDQVTAIFVDGVGEGETASQACGRHRGLVVVYGDNLGSHVPTPLRRRRRRSAHVASQPETALANVVAGDLATAPLADTNHRRMNTRTLFITNERLSGEKRKAGTASGLNAPEKEDGMKNSGLLLSAMMLASSLGAVAQAETVLYSAPVASQSGEGLNCVALNVGKTAHNLQVDVIEVFSNTVLDSELDMASPGGIVSASGNGTDGTYCRFTADGSKHDVRASAMVQTLATGATLSVVPVLPQ